jgi:hypothetical protein
MPWKLVAGHGDGDPVILGILENFMEFGISMANHPFPWKSMAFQPTYLLYQAANA